MEAHDLSDYVRASKDVMDLLKVAVGFLPKGAQRAEAEQKIAAAQEMLARSDAKLAKELGFHLCRCTYPPQPMLWREAEKAHVCQNAACQHKISTEFGVNRSGGTWIKSRSGRI
jgi:hypothetical protein